MKWQLIIILMLIPMISAATLDVNDREKIVVRGDTVVLDDKIDINLYRGDKLDKVTDLFVNDDGKNYKFGGTGSLCLINCWQKGRYIFNSTLPLEKIGAFYYYKEGLGGYRLDVSDVCSVNNSNCNLYEEDGQLILDFYSGRVIDPTFTFVFLESEMILQNVQYFGSNYTSLTLDDSDIIFYANFDVDDTSTSYDFTSDDNDGSYLGDSQTNETLCFSNKCAELQGTNDYINYGSALNVGKINFTLSLWVYPIDNGAQQAVITKWGNSMYFGFQSDEDLIWAGTSGFPGYRQRSSSNASNKVVFNEWNHIAVSVNHTDLTLYRNGHISETFNDLDGQNNWDSDALLIGTRVSLTDDTYGNVDEVIIYDRKLTDAEMYTLFLNQTSKFNKEGFQTMKQFNATLQSNWIEVEENTIEQTGTSVTKRYGGWNVDYGYNTSYNDLVAYYPFDGTYEEHTGQQATPLLTGQPTNATGTFNGSYYFDGGDYFRIGTASTMGIPLGRNNLTVSLWFTKSSSTELATFSYGTTSGRRWSMFVQNTLHWERGGGSLTGSTLVNDSEWHHFLMTYDNETATVTMYLDGQYENSKLDVLNLGDSTVYVGAYSGVQRYEDNIDEVMIFNSTLTPAEVKELYVKGNLNWQWSGFQDTDYFNVDTNYTNHIVQYNLTADSNNFTSPYIFSHESAPINLTDTGDVDTCGYFDTQGGTYNLINNIDTTGDCFVILADNITLNLNSYYINTSTVSVNDIGVESLADSSTVKDGIIYTFGKGITLNGDYNNVSNITYQGDGGSYGVGSKISAVQLKGDYNNIQHNLVENCYQSDVIADLYSISLDGSSGNTIKNNIFRNNYAADIATGIGITSGKNNVITNNNVSTHYGGFGMALWNEVSGGGNDTIVNLVMKNNTQGFIATALSGGDPNTIIFNNSFGEIKIIDQAFLVEPTLYGEITFPGNITIGNNSAYMNVDVLTALNKSANITLYGIGDRGIFSPAIFKDNDVCNDCYEYTSVTDDTVIFNVTGWSTYSIKGITVTYPLGRILPINNAIPYVQLNQTLDFT